MKTGFQPGIVRHVSIDVTPDMCPAFDGVVVHKVYSTWSVAHHFEIAARKVLVDFLEAHEEGVGAYVSVDHLAPCTIGSQVEVEAELVEVIKGHHIKVICECRAYCGHRLLARGKQVQVVMDKEHLKRYLERS
jgi:predicted thioesterase